MTKYITSITLMIAINAFSTLCNAQGDGVNDFKFRITSMLQNRITIPSAPEAASLGKYGDYKVNTFSGLPKISIPLYGIQGSELSMSFNLNYEGGGIKVEQVPTWVGSGWSLNGGGVITRAVKGDPDMKINYFNYHALLNQNFNTSYSDLFAENNFMLKAATKEVETQPDIFYFNMGSHSGKFYIKADQSQPVLMSESKDLIFTPYINSGTGNVDSFYVKDAQGITYVFNIAETTTLFFNTDYGYLSRSIPDFVFNSSWYLSKIINSNSTETIELKYITEGAAYNPYQYVNYNNYKSVTYHHGTLASVYCPEDLCPYGTAPSEFNGVPTSTTIANRRFLSEVILLKGTTAVEKLKFSSSVNTYLGGGRKLDTIGLFKGPNAAVRVLNQVLSYDNTNFRLSLTQVQEKSPSGTTKEPYVFTYITGLPNSFTTNAIDHWGYFNNAISNVSLIPAILCPGVNANSNAPNCQGMNNPTTGADRSPNETFAKAGILSRIKYPTKGYTDFIWEGNRAIAGDMICGDSTTERLVGGLRIKEINNYSFVDTQLTSKKYSYKFSNGSCSGLLFYQPRYFTSSIFTRISLPSNACVDVALSGIRTSYTFNSSSIVPLGSIQGGLVGYSRVEESFAGKTVYNFRNYIPNFVAWGITEDQDIQDLGQLLSIEEYNDAGQKVHAIGYKYSIDINESRRNQLIFGLMVEASDQQNNFNSLCRVGSTYSWEHYSYGGTCDQFVSYHSKFIRRHYKITQDWVYNKEVTDTMFYFNGSTATGSVTKLISDTYGNVNISYPTEKVMTNSDGKVYKKIYKFAHDVSNSSMISRNIIGIPLQTETYLGTSLTYLSRTDYNTFATTGLQSAGGPWLLPFKFYERFSGGADTLRETIDRYDVSGTQVQEGRKQNDSPVTVLYSQNAMVPSAKILNASYLKCAFTGFESSDGNQGSWAISTTSNISPDANSKTGLGLYTGTGTITKSNVAAGNYILSYWLLNQSNALTINGVGTTAVSSSISAVADPDGWRFVQHKISTTVGANVTVNGVAAVSIDELRLHPVNAFMTTNSYNRNTRLLSGASNENSQPTKFEYDGLLRLTGIRNFNNAYQKIVDYNYKTSAATYNFIKGSDVLQDVPVTSVAGVNALTGSAVRRMFDYMDDIGRPLQSIGVAQSPLSKDVIMPHTYDVYGREVNVFLPYADQTNPANGALRAAATVDQTGFFNSQFSGEGAYAKQTMAYEPSPLSRVLSETPPGAAFSTHPVSYVYATNTTSEVRNFTTTNAYYAANSLHKVTRLDENGNSVITYTDKLGLKVMESVSGAQTYYLYDGLQNLIQVIQPETVAQSPTDALSSTAIQNGSFLYTFDFLNRLISKKVPGTSSPYTYIYDRLDREVLRTDPNGTKLYTKYDILSRVIMSGLYSGAGTILGTEPLYETVTATAPYYTNASTFPTASTAIYTVNYYDDYNFDETGVDEVSYVAPTGGSITYGGNYPFVLGKSTGTRTAILKLDGSAPTAYIEDYPFYDIFGREIHHKNVHHLGGTDLSWMKYDFPGRLLNTRLQHNTSITTAIINQRFTYDHASRILNTYHQIGDVPATEKLISTQSYNERDELATKTLGGGLQTVDYSYNIRKWLTKINDPAVSNADLFAQRLYYDAPPATTPASFTALSQYNGNIAFTEWRTGANWTINGATRNLAGYTYGYDGLNRLTSAKYSDYIGSYGSTLGDRYTVNNLSYDKNGNIKTMTRGGQLTATMYGTVDNLTYTYDPNKINQLASISDASSSTQGFRSGSAGTYTYDLNGNMTSDASKNITAITYNHLNLPRIFTFSTGNTIEMTYDASGMKLSKVVKQGATVVSRMDYIKGIEYQNSKLQAIYHSEGRVAFCDATQTQSITAPINGETKNFKAGMITAASSITGSANVTMQAGTNMTYLPGFQVEQGSTFWGSILSPPCVAATAYEYVIRDHLGNGRIYFTDYNGNGAINESNGEILQEAHYDPWGFALGGSWVNNSAVDNLYQYSGNEQNADFGLNQYDFSARWLDVSIGRFLSVDPMAEDNYMYSPFHYASNNPILFIDPDGLNDIYYDGYDVIREIENDKDDRYYSGTLNEDNTITVTNQLAFAPIKPIKMGFYGGIPGRLDAPQSAGGAFSDFGQNLVANAAYAYATGEVLGWVLKPLGGLVGKLFSSVAEKGMRFTQSGADALVVRLKNQYKGNVTVMKDGVDVFRVHQPGSHGRNISTITKIVEHQTAKGPVRRAASEVSSFDQSTFEMLNKAANRQGGYSLRTLSGR